MQVKVQQLHPDAVIPTYAHTSDAGLDLTAISKEEDDHGNVVYGTGLAFAIPDGYVGLLYPRSSNAKKGLLLCNSVGVVDSGYRGEVFLKFKKIGDSDNSYNIGERIAQLVIMPYPKIELIATDSLDESERGAGGFGSTGN